MNFESEYIAYLALFRLAIIASGTISITLGYRLFLRVMTEHSTNPNSSITAKMGATSFTLRNTAPGTAFCLFGIVLIATMLVQGTPELVYQTLKAGSNTNDLQQSIKMRGDSTSSTFQYHLERGKRAEAARNEAEAANEYEEALAEISLPMNQLAAIYIHQNELGKALSLAQLATEISPNDGDTFDTLADIQEKRGNISEAIKAMEMAVALKPNAHFREKLLFLKRKQL